MQPLATFLLHLPPWLRIVGLSLPAAGAAAGSHPGTRPARRGPAHRAVVLARRGPRDADARGTVAGRTLDRGRRVAGRGLGRRPAARGVGRPGRAGPGRRRCPDGRGRCAGGRLRLERGPRVGGARAGRRAPRRRGGQAGQREPRPGAHLAAGCRCPPRPSRGGGSVREPARPLGLVRAARARASGPARRARAQRPGAPGRTSRPRRRGGSRTTGRRREHWSTGSPQGGPATPSGCSGRPTPSSTTAAGKPPFAAPSRPFRSRRPRPISTR